MRNVKNREHDFSTKLRQAAVIEHLRDYIAWQRGMPEAARPEAGPISINLDLTASCNFACPHCVDSSIINSGEQLRTGDILASIDLLSARGLRSVILLGGGEPCLHPELETVVAHIKARGLQLGIVTNGTRLDRVIAVAGALGAGDWVRLSIDAATEETFLRSHRPRAAVTLAGILESAAVLKARHPQVSLGYSFVVVWPGIGLNGGELCPNVDEMPGAVLLASRHGFDYISFKPCLIRQADSGRESLLDGVDGSAEDAIATAVRSGLEQARAAANGSVRVLESVNLTAMLQGRVRELKHQPRRCHMAFFRTVLAPSGIYFCPAFRGVAAARIGGPQGYVDDQRFQEVQQRLHHSIARFDAARECRVVGCFYHHVNWWIEDMIAADTPPGDIPAAADDNFFL